VLPAAHYRTIGCSKEKQVKDNNILPELEST